MEQIIHFFCTHTGYLPQDISNIKINCNNLSMHDDKMNGTLECHFIMKNNITILINHNL